MILTLFCGGGWTRTTELIRGQIYSLLQLPLCDSPRFAENKHPDRLLTLKFKLWLFKTKFLKKL